MIDPPLRYQTRVMQAVPEVGTQVWARYQLLLDLRPATVTEARSQAPLDISVLFENGTRGQVSRLEALHSVSDLQRLWMACNGRDGARFFTRAAVVGGMSAFTGLTPLPWPPAGVGNTVALQQQLAYLPPPRHQPPPVWNGPGLPQPSHPPPTPGGYGGKGEAGKPGMQPSRHPPPQAWAGL
eukprot:1248235-Rhodomonas_salina.1